MALQPLGRAEVAIQGHEDMAFVGEDAVGEIDGAGLCAADRKTWKDVEQGLGHETASSAWRASLAWAPCLRKASSIRTNQSSVLRSALPCACSLIELVTRSRST